jgi:hypothetical protein
MICTQDVHVGLNVMCWLTDIDENSSGLTDCKNCHIRFHENPFCTYHIVTDTYGQRNFDRKNAGFHMHLKMTGDRKFL